MSDVEQLQLVVGFGQRSLGKSTRRPESKFSFFNLRWGRREVGGREEVRKVRYSEDLWSISRSTTDDGCRFFFFFISLSLNLIIKSNLVVKERC